MSETKFTPGPWCWYGSTYAGGHYNLATEYGGRHHVMGFKRSGTQGAQPTFQVNRRMVPASELVIFDVCPSVVGKTAGRASPEVYREDFTGLSHPDATLIAAAPELYAELLHLVRLMEPLEDRGQLDIPGLATLNGARAALAKARGEQ